jgi:hypothetical protein
MILRMSSTTSSGSRHILGKLIFVFAVVTPEIVSGFSMRYINIY